MNPNQIRSKAFDFLMEYQRNHCVPNAVKLLSRKYIKHVKKVSVKTTSDGWGRFYLQFNSAPNSAPKTASNCRKQP